MQRKHIHIPLPPSRSWLFSAPAPGCASFLRSGVPRSPTSSQGAVFRIKILFTRTVPISLSASQAQAVVLYTRHLETSATAPHTHARRAHPATTTVFTRPSLSASYIFLQLRGPREPSGSVSPLGFPESRLKNTAKQQQQERHTQVPQHDFHTPQSPSHHLHPHAPSSSLSLYSLAPRQFSNQARGASFRNLGNGARPDLR